MERDIERDLPFTQNRDIDLPGHVYLHLAKYEGAAVYKITNRKTKKTYIGSSIDVVRRMNEHTSSLYNNCHSNAALQEDYNFGAIFDASILKRFSQSATVQELRNAEKEFIEYYSENTYNIGGVSGMNQYEHVHYRNLYCKSILHKLLVHFSGVCSDCAKFYLPISRHIEGYRKIDSGAIVVKMAYEWIREYAEKHSVDFENAIAGNDENYKLFIKYFNKE